MEGKKPRNVRNFWIEVKADGVKNLIATGPKSKDGGFKIVIRQREAGGISPRTMEIAGKVIDGILVTSAAVMEDRKVVSRHPIREDFQELSLETKQ